MMKITECFYKIGGEVSPDNICNFLNSLVVNFNEAFKEIMHIRDYNGLPFNIKSFINQRTIKKNL